MVFTIILAAIFIGSVGTLWYRISHKIPELVAIPDEVIVERLHEDSARIRVFLLSWRRYWQEQEHWQLFWRVLERALHRLHILLLRTDNGTVNLLKKVRTAGGFPNGNGNGSIYSQTPPQEMDIRAAGDSFGPPRIQEVRRKRKDSVPV